MSKGLLIINPASGKAKNEDLLNQMVQIAKDSQNLELKLIHLNDDVGKIVRRAISQGATIVGVAGGDGTLNMVAAALVGTGVPLLAVPFGTLNHFARDIGMPDHPIEALKLFEGGIDQAVDVGEVNGHFFLNNSSVGFHPFLVKNRGKYEKDLGRVAANWLTSLDFLQKPQLLNIDVELGDTTIKEKVGLILISNNRAVLSPQETGHRESLNRHKLHVFIVESESTLELFQVGISFLSNTFEYSPLVTEFEAAHATISSDQPEINVTCDGELRNLRSPLVYRIRPEALVVRLPAQ